MWNDTKIGQEDGGGDGAARLRGGPMSTSAAGALRAPARSPFRPGVPRAPANDAATGGARCITFSGHAGADAPLPLRPRRIIVGVDFSPVSEAARRLALGIAHASDAIVDLVHVLDAFNEVFIRENRQIIDHPDTLPDEIEQALLCRGKMARAQGVRCVHSSLVGVPGLELAGHAARTDADLIVLGATEEQPARFGWTWGARAAEQILWSGRWRGLILLRRLS